MPVTNWVTRIGTRDAIASKTNCKYLLRVLYVLHVYDIELSFHSIAESACIRKTGICVGNWERKIYVAHYAGELGKYTKKERKNTHRKVWTFFFSNCLQPCEANKKILGRIANMQLLNSCLESYLLTVNVKIEVSQLKKSHWHDK